MSTFTNNQNLIQAAQDACPEGFEVFVGRMPLGTSDTELRNLAETYNPSAVRVLSKPDRNGHMCGFVTFHDLKMAQDFIEENNDKDALGGGDAINVRFADGKARKKVFVGGLPAGTGEDDLKAIAAPYGVVLSVKILSKNQKAPCGFVVFASPQQAETFIAQLHDRPNTAGSKNYVVRFAKAPEIGKNKGGPVGYGKRGAPAMSPYGQQYASPNYGQPSPNYGQPSPVEYDYNAKRYRTTYDNQPSQFAQQSQLYPSPVLVKGVGSPSATGCENWLAAPTPSTCTSSVATPHYDGGYVTSPQLSSPQTQQAYGQPMQQMPMQTMAYGQPMQQMPLAEGTTINTMPMNNINYGMATTQSYNTMPLTN